MRQRRKVDYSDPVPRRPRDHQVLTYQPAGRFWTFQGIEAAIFVALAIVVVAIAYRVVSTRDA